MAGRTIAKNLGSKSQRLVFFVGLLLAALSAVLVFVIASSTGGGGGGSKVPVVTAADTIPAQTRITSGMLQVTLVSQDDALADTFSSRGQVIDRVTTKEVAAGAQIQAEMVSSSVGEGVTFVVQPGYRAISVDVREVVTAGGNLKPGDHIDIVAIFEVPNVQAANVVLSELGFNYGFDPAAFPADVNADGEADSGSDRFMLTVTMLQDVKLLAVAQSLTEVTAGGTVADESNDADTNPRAATATLELKPQQAQQITWADHYGVLRMDARAVGDNEIVDVRPTLARLEKTN